jgi:hypothetical protein
MRKIVFIVMAALGASALFAATSAATKPRAKRTEPSVVADLRAFAAAQAAYAKVNGGFFDEPPCLVTPSKCLKSYPAKKPGFLSRELGRMDMRDGYNRSFHVGHRAPDAVLKGGNVSPSSLEEFVYVAVPKVKGQPAYCVDHKRMCVQKDGIMPRPEMSCPRTCETIE